MLAYIPYMDPMAYSHESHNIQVDSYPSFQAHLLALDVAGNLRAPKTPRKRYAFFGASGGHQTCSWDMRFHKHNSNIYQTSKMFLGHFPRKGQQLLNNDMCFVVHNPSAWITLT